MVIGLLVGVQVLLGVQVNVKVEVDVGVKVGLAVGVNVVGTVTVVVTVTVRFSSDTGLDVARGLQAATKRITVAANIPRKLLFKLLGRSSTAMVPSNGLVFRELPRSSHCHRLRLIISRRDSQQEQKLHENSYLPTPVP